MPLWNPARLHAVPLGVSGHESEHASLPALRDGVHLRWSFDKKRGFPLGGYTVFRRPHAPEPMMALMTHVIAARAESTPATTQIPGANGSVMAMPSLPIGPSSSPWALAVVFGAVDIFAAPGAQTGVDQRSSDFGLILGTSGGPRQPARLVAQTIAVSLAFPFGTGEVTFRVLLDGGLLEFQTIEERTVSSTDIGEAGVVRFSHDAMMGLFVSSGSAVITEIQVERVQASGGWALLTPEPVFLPVRHPDYNGQTPNLAASEDEAVARVVYGDGNAFRGAPFADLHSLLQQLVAAGGPLDERTLTNVPAYAASSAATLDQYSPVEWLRLALVDPAVAQMLGLYFLDSSADAAAAYDYLVLGAFEGLGSPSQLLAMVNSSSFDYLSKFADSTFDAWICSNVTTEELTLPTPEPPLAFSLPTPEGVGRVGLAWPPPNAAEHSNWLEGIFPFRPLIGANTPTNFRLWQAFLGNAPEPTTPAQDDFEILDQRFLVGTANDLPGSGDVPSGWPPHRLRAIVPVANQQTRVDEGWYSYRLGALNLFGASRTSDPGLWRQWTPPPAPKPWYYDDALGDGVVHPFAVRLLDKTPPPIPSAISATLIDPRDPYRETDAAFTAWQAALPAALRKETCALRVSWEWTRLQKRAAPDIAEFRIYLRHGRFNAELGRTETVTAGQTDDTSQVATDIDKAYAAGALAGATLQLGVESFDIVRHRASGPGNALVLVVRNRGNNDEIRPRADAACAVVLPETHPTFVDVSEVESWGHRIHVHAADAGSTPGCHPKLDGIVAEGADVSLSFSPSVRATFAPGTDLSRVVPGIDQLFLRDGSEETSHFISAVEVSPARLTLASAPDHDHYPEWRIGPTAGDVVLEGSANVSGGYEFIVPGAANLSNVRPGVDVLWLGSGSNGQLFEIGEVDRANRRLRVTDGPLPVGSRSFAIGLGFERFDVLLPPPGNDAASLIGEPTALQGKLVAQVGISAVDDKTHTHDNPYFAGTPFGDRPGNESAIAGPREVYRVRRTVPDPPADVVFDSDAVFATRADYHKQSFYTVRWPYQQGLGVHVFRASDESVYLADWKSRRPRGGWTASSTSFPSSWSTAKKSAVADELNQLDAALPAPPNPGPNSLPSAGSSQALPIYRDRRLSNDALRALASQPEVTSAFRQVNVAPLNQNEAKYADHVGPDNEGSYQPQASLRALRDTLGGHSTNRYFYRVAYLDRAQNRGSFGRATPPVYLPNVVPPRAPQISSVSGGDRTIHLLWTRSNDVTGYAIHMANNREALKDLRLLPGPEARIPAHVFQISAGTVDLTRLPATEILRVYNADALTPGTDPHIGAGATHYVSSPQPAVDMLGNIAAIDGTNVVIVYRDKQGGIQHTSLPNGTVAYSQPGVPAGQKFYFAVVAERDIDIGSLNLTIRSKVSAVAAAEAYDIAPPDPAVWQEALWVLVDDLGSEHPWTATPGTWKVAVRLLWTRPAGAQSLLQRRASNGFVWETISPWLSDTKWRDESLIAGTEYVYRIKTRASNGQTMLGPSLSPESASP